MLQAWCPYCFFPMETQQCIIPVPHSGSPEGSLCLEQAPAVVSLGTDWNGRKINKLKCFQECLKYSCETQPTCYGKSNVYNVVWEHGLQRQNWHQPQRASVLSQRLCKSQNNLSQVFKACGNHVPYCYSPHLTCTFVFKIWFNSFHLEGLSSNTFKCMFCNHEKQLNLLSDLLCIDICS